MNGVFNIRIALPALLMLAMAALGGTSCVKEKLEDCPPVKLVIDIDMDIDMDVVGDDPTLGGRVTRSDIREWYSGIDTVSVWIFDRNERFVAQWNGGPYTPGREYEVPVGEMGLGGGRHTFVVWTNRGDLYEVNHADPDPEDNLYLDDFEMRMKIPAAGAMRQDLRHRHYGILEANLTPTAPGRSAKTTILIRPNLHKVNFSFGGVTPDENDYSLDVVDSNSAHSFLNEYVEGRGEYRHRRHMAFPEADTPPATRADGDSSSLTASLLLMRLHDDTGTRVEVTRHAPGGDELLYNEDLVSLINRVYAFNGQRVDFDHTLEFDVDIDFMSSGDANMKLAITINGWTYIEEITIL